VLVVQRCGALAANHRVACVAASSAAANPARRWLKSAARRWTAQARNTMPVEFMFGRPLSPEELDMIREQIKSMDDITAIDDEVRDIVERNWPHLVSKLPPREE
jgi:hypothetical protein